MQKLRQHIEQIVALTDTEFEFILSHFTIKKLKKHQYLVQEGEYVHSDFWVIKGLLKAYQNDSDGKQHIINLRQKTGGLPIIKLTLGKLKATLNVDCLEDTEVLCLSLEKQR